MSKYPAANGFISRLVRGSATIGGIEECNRLLAEYPGNPYVTRLLADFLKKERSFFKASTRYRESYELFMAAGETLQALAALLEQWEIVTPTPRDYRGLHADLRRKNSHRSAISECFATMSYPELRSTISRLEKIRVGAEEVVQAAGESEDALYFVISGELVRSSPEAGSDQTGEIKFLKANDHFGDDHSFDKRGTTTYQVTAASAAELLKISKDDFRVLCGEH
ncbi:MAG: cyclic nucleotide-binding domain-containing protein, partial [Desulfurivibrionaceae bacterium]|nr:cyclic nucleotide-binding domain-containing protein [Desulfurivibrionaceae bacterium]